MRRDPEHDVLLACARRFLGLAPDEAVLKTLPAELDGSRLAELALREGLAGIAASELGRLARERSLELSLTRLREAFRRIFLTNGCLLAELARLRDAFAEQGLRAIALKGTALLRADYRDQLALRPLSDVDLLVHQEALPRFEALLLERGYRRGETAGFFSNGRAGIDLHTDLVGSRRIPRRALAARFDSAGLWERAMPLEKEGDPLYVLSAEDQLLHLAVHGQKHSFTRLIWLVDIALVARRVAWSTLRARVRETGTGRSLAYAALALEALFGPVAPPALRESLSPLNAAERLFVRAIIDRRPMTALGELVLVFSLERWRERLAYLLEYAFPRKAPGGATSWMGYPRRAGKLLSGGVAEASRLTRAGRP